MSAALFDFLTEACKQGKPVDVGLTSGREFEKVRVSHVAPDAVEVLQSMGQRRKPRPYVIVLTYVEWAVLS